MKRRIAWLLILSVLLGCGGAVSPPPKSPTKQRSSTPRPLPEYDAKPQVAAKAESAVKQRRGSWSLTSDKVAEIADFVKDNSAKYNVPEDLLFGIIWVESRFDPKAVSPVGARGLMQLMPKTARYLGECIAWEGRINPFNPEFNIAAGSYYIARLIREFNGNEELALAAYNAGPTKVRKWLESSQSLPNVSIEYAAMVQTARTFFGGSRTTPKSTPAATSAETFIAARQVSTPKDVASTETPIPAIITDEELDRLGLTILIAGLQNDRFRIEREDLENPFN